MLGMGMYAYCRRFPAHAKRFLVQHAKKQLRGEADIAHFTPRYNPWDQRLCLVPDADLFEAVREHRASVVTDHIDTFTDKGIRLRSGKELEADLVVTATGLKLKLLGGIHLEVDGRRIDPAKTMLYKGTMCSDVPNLAMAIGYTNASWTLKCDLVARYVCRLLNHMDVHGYARCCPRRDPSVEQVPLIDFSSGYILRAQDRLPRQGSVRPWKLYQNYALDLLMIERGRLDDGVMEFSAPPKRTHAGAHFSSSGGNGATT
jgi:cation diffusion facilitator CzcD-associated flavoprotein CzcO